MSETFTFDNTIPRWLDYARFRVADIKPDAPLLFDETYLAMLTQHGPVEGLALCAANIAVQISAKVTSFGEAAGIRFSKRNLDYYQELPDLIRSEPAFIEGAVGSSVTRGILRAGSIPVLNTSSLDEVESYRIAMKLTLPQMGERTTIVPQRRLRTQMTMPPTYRIKSR